MADSATFLTIPTAFPARRTTPCSLVSRVFPAEQRRSLRVNALALAQKWEPTKVVPQADRVLVRLEQLPEVGRHLDYVSECSLISTPYGVYEISRGVLLPKSAVKFERYLMGEVLSVGADVGAVDARKKVLFSDISAYEVELETDAKHCFVKAGDLIAVVE